MLRLVESAFPPDPSAADAAQPTAPPVPGMRTGRGVGRGGERPLHVRARWKDSADSIRRMPKIWSGSVATAASDDLHERRSRHAS